MIAEVLTTLEPLALHDEAEERQTQTFTSDEEGWVQECVDVLECRFYSRIDAGAELTPGTYMIEKDGDVQTLTWRHSALDEAFSLYAERITTLLEEGHGPNEHKACEGCKDFRQLAGVIRDAVKRSRQSSLFAAADRSEEQARSIYQTLPMTADAAQSRSLMLLLRLQGEIQG